MPANSLGPRMPEASAATAARCLLALALLAGATHASSAAADDEPLAMEFVSPATSPQSGRATGERWAIYLNGRIDETAAERLRDELARRDLASASVYLNSPGGDLGQGMELGRVIRERGFSTYVGRQNGQGSTPLAGECYSACVFAFIGGYYRFYSPRSRIGVHRFSAASPTGADSDAAQIVSAAIVNYIRNMEVDVGLFDRMSRAGKDEILVLAKTDLERLRVVNNGRLAAEWAIESSNGVTYLKGAQQTSLGTGEILLSCGEGQVVFHAHFDAGDNAEAVRDSAKQHLLRIGDGYAPLADPLQPISVHDGQVAAEFALSREQVNRLRTSSAVGYAARLGDPNVFAGFSIDTPVSATAKISSFVEDCKR